MNAESSQNQKKSLVLTTLVYSLLLLLLFFLRFWPPANMKLMGGGGGGGIEMNFGDSDYGLGDNYKSEVLNVKDQAKATPAAPTPEEDVIADDNSETNDAVIPKHENVKKTPVVVKKDLPKPAPEKPKVSKNANDALSSILGNKGGDGNDGKSGNKGSANGNLNSSGYYGNGTGSGGGTGGGNGPGNGPGSGPGNGPGSGGGTGGGYFLGNRKALNKPKPDNVCGNEYGRVAVQVTVDRNGNAISVTPGVQGTTNTDNCLLQQAKRAAQETKWQADSNAPEKQVGKIIYVFSLN
ncbi:energy transducer TonB [Flavobacterium sp. XGLA_31]|uniref:energy transducer TonB n=1 Tax=Flavobacterium sp. XGLA_31 TaxID=3447666 RepID=UPI003F2E5BCA